MKEELGTIKDLYRKLKEHYKYVRMFELSISLKLENYNPMFNKMLIVSNELEEYSNLQMEVDNIQLQIETAKLDLFFYDFVPKTAIPIFVFERKVDF